jgi:capsular polysaccharide biosynthesis protein
MNLLTAMPGQLPGGAISTAAPRARKTLAEPTLKERTRQFAKRGQKALRVARVTAAAGLRAIPVVRDSLHIPRNETFSIHSSHSDGVRIHMIAPERRFERPLPHMPEETDVHFRFTQENRGTYGATFVAELTRGRIWGHYGGSVFTRNGQLIPLLSKDVWGPRLHSAFARARLPNPEWLPGRTLSLITPEASANFHHWMVDLLPRIGMVERAGYSLQDFDRILIKYRGLPFQRETLRRAGVDERRIMVVSDDSHLEAETLVVPSMHMEDVRVCPEDMRYVRSLYLPSEPAPGTAWRRLYVGRSDAEYRRLLNRETFTPLFERYGFEEVAMSRYSVEEGAKLFSEAAVIIGPNGSALANLLFAHPECKVIEFFAPEWVVCYNWMIATNMGLDYTAMIGDGARPPAGTLPRQLRQDIAIEPSRLERVLADILPHG